MSVLAKHDEGDSRVCILTGRLRYINFGTLLGLLAGERYSGWLTVKDVGAIGLCNGNVTCASTQAATGTRAVFELFLVGDGEFMFEVGDCPHGPALGSVMALSMEGCRLLDEWNRLSAMVLGAYQGRAGAAYRGLIDDFEGLLDGVTTVGELAMELAAPPLELIDPLLADLAAGIVANVAPPDPKRAQAAVNGQHDNPSSFELIDRSRELMRAGDLTRAAIALRRVLRVEPQNRVARQNLRHIGELQRAAQ